VAAYWRGWPVLRWSVTFGDLAARFSLRSAVKITSVVPGSSASNMLIDNVLRDGVWFFSRSSFLYLLYAMWWYGGAACLHYGIRSYPLYGSVLLLLRDVAAPRVPAV